MCSGQTEPSGCVSRNVKDHFFPKSTAGTGGPREERICLKEGTCVGFQVFLGQYLGHADRYEDQGVGPAGWIDSSLGVCQSPIREEDQGGESQQLLRCCNDCVFPSLGGKWEAGPGEAPRSGKHGVMCRAGFPGGSEVEDPPDNAGDEGSIPGSGRSPGGEHAFLPGKPRGQRSLVSRGPRGCSVGHA